MKRNAILVPVVSLVLAGGAAFSAQAVSSHRDEPRQQNAEPTYSQPVQRPKPLPRYIKTFCDHGNRLYVNRETGDLAVAAQDPTCAIPAPPPKPGPTSTAPTTATTTTSGTTTTTTTTTKPPTSTPPTQGGTGPRGNDGPRDNGGMQPPKPPTTTPPTPAKS